MFVDIPKFLKHRQPMESLGFVSNPAQFSLRCSAIFNREDGLIRRINPYRLAKDMEGLPEQFTPTIKKYGITVVKTSNRPNVLSDLIKVN